MRKNRIGIISLMLAAVLLLSACGSGRHGPVPTQTPGILDDSGFAPEAGQELLGAWQNSDENDRFIYLFQDGEWVACDEDGIEHARASYTVSDGQLKLDNMTAQYKVSLFGRVLVLQDTREPYGRFILFRITDTQQAGNPTEPAPSPTTWDTLNTDPEELISRDNYAAFLNKLSKKTIRPEESGEIRSDQEFVYRAVRSYFGVPEEKGRYCCAALAEEKCWVNGSRADIPLGAAVYFSGNHESCPSCGREDAGHVGVYVGDGKVIHRSAVYQNGVRQENVIRVDAIDEITAWGYHYEGWGWQAEYELQEGYRDKDWTQTVFIVGEKSPEQLEWRKPFELKGVISVDTGKIISVYGAVYDSEGNKKILPEKNDKPIMVDGTTCDLHKLLDSKLVFGSLPPGRYRYRVIVTLPMQPETGDNVDADTRDVVAGIKEGQKIVLDVPFSVVAKNAPTPEGLKAVREGENSARISWNACDGAVEYEVQYYSETKGEWVPDGSYESGTEYVSTGLQKHENWKFRVRAILQNGVVTKWARVDYPMAETP